MAIPTSSVQRLLLDHVVELSFVRRHPKPGWSDNRRMLCTNNFELLNSVPGHTSLNFRPPKGYGLKFDPTRKNLAVAWDLFWQDFRLIPLESVRVVAALPVRTKEEKDHFWNYFNQYLQSMSPAAKVNFMQKG